MSTPAVREAISPDGLSPDALEAFRPGLHGYCYRMLGSPFEADDAVQETLIRAWLAASDFEGRSSVRTWVYRIATNICIDMLRGRTRRASPMDLGPAISNGGAPADADPAYPWVLPIPDARISGDPAERVVAKETIRLAFVAALAHLPARQRAVLILRDVLGWHADEVADLLETSVPSVTSALQRARVTMAARDLTAAHTDDLGDAQKALLADYVDAFERYDIAALTKLLRADAVQTMPPYPMWLSGAADITGWMTGYGADCRGSVLVSTSGNGCPGFGQYREGGREPWGVHLLEIRDGRVAAIRSFIGAEYFRLFGLPERLDR